MSTFTDDFTHDYFADGTYTLLGGTVALNVAGGVGTCPSISEWIDPRVQSSVVETSIDVLAGSDIYLVGLGLITADGSAGLDVLVLFNGTWQMVCTPGGTLNAAGAFTVPAGDWTLHLSVTANAMTATVESQTLTLDLPPDNAAAVLAAASLLSPLGAVGSASLIGHGGATVVVDNFFYSTTGGGGGPPPPATPSLVLAGAHTAGAVARPGALL